VKGNTSERGLQCSELDACAWLWLVCTRTERSEDFFGPTTDGPFEDVGLDEVLRKFRTLED
jgi:hypothetical protein